MESNPTPTIAELWREFSIFEGNDPLYCRKKYASSDEMREFFDGQIARMEDLRAQLLERCHRVADVYGYYTVFSIVDGCIWSLLLKWDNTRTDQSRTDNAETAMEYWSAVRFWAWELEQRQRESTSTAATTQQQP